MPEAGYLGSKGQHLIDGESNMPLSQLPASVLSLGRCVERPGAEPVLLTLQGIEPDYHAVHADHGASQDSCFRNIRTYTGISALSAFRRPIRTISRSPSRRTSAIRTVYSYWPPSPRGKLLDDASQTVSFLGAAGGKSRITTIGRPTRRSRLRTFPGAW